MNLTDFPRPFADNGRGVHWSMSCYWDSQGKQDWGFWSEQVQAMGIKWAKIIDDGGGSALLLARRLVDIGVMPVVRFYWPEQNPGNIGSRGQDAVREYLKWGVCYFETNNEPDLALEWKDRRRPDNWLDIVVDNFIHDAYGILEAGGHPAVPAFGVGTRDNPYERIVDRGCSDILDGGAWGAVHDYCLARPLEYPNDAINLKGIPITEEEWQDAGGMWAWEMSADAVNEARQEFKQPNASILTDATCFRAFEQVNHYVTQACGHSIPLMMTEGGYNVGQRAGTTEGDDARYPKPTPWRTSGLSLRMFEYMQGTETVLGEHVPDYFFCAMPWLIANYRMHVYQPPAEEQGPWFTHKYDQEWDLHGELPLVQMLKDLPTRVRQDGPVPTIWLLPKESDALGDAWDSRLDWIGVEYQPHAQSVWKLVEARWLDEEEAAGACSIFVKALDEQGKPLEGITFVVSRDGGLDVAETKGALDGYWGNSAMYGAVGTYTVGMFGMSDSVTGVGFGVETWPHDWAQTSFQFTFQLGVVSQPVEPEPPDVTEALAQMRVLKERWQEVSVGCQGRGIAA